MNSVKHKYKPLLRIIRKLKFESIPINKGILNEAFLTEDMISEAYTIALARQELHNLVFQLNVRNDYFGFGSISFERFKVRMDLAGVNIHNYRKPGTV